MSPPPTPPPLPPSVPRVPQQQKSSEQLLAEALRARAGTAATAVREADEPRMTAQAPPLTVTQLVLAALIAGLVVGILVAVFTLL